MIMTIHADYPPKLKSVKLLIPLQSCYMYHRGKMHTPLLESILPIYKGLRGWCLTCHGLAIGNIPCLIIYVMFTSFQPMGYCTKP
jgi:hypothetical protein